MWTETHFYCFPSKEDMPQSTSGALDIIGETDDGFLVNARWLDEEQDGWAAYRIYPASPQRDFF